MGVRIDLPSTTGLWGLGIKKNSKMCDRDLLM
jgi:hypothetical protein